MVIKSKKRIRVEGHWDKPENILKRLLLQFKTPQIDLSDIIFVFDNSFDYCVCFNHINVPILPNKKYYVFPHEPIWAGSHQKKFTENSTVFGFEQKYYTGNCIETVSHTFYGGRGPWVDSLDIWNYDNLSNKIFNKSKNISSCITEINYDYGLYKKRFNLLKNILPLNFIDFYGCSGQNLPNTLSSQYKIDSTENYKFTICVENDFQNNWLTERFYDAILTDCIPIYYGCKNLKEIYPEDGYILLENIEDLNSIKNLLIQINKNADSIYQQKIENSRKIKERYLSEFNLLKKIISLN